LLAYYPAGTDVPAALDALERGVAFLEAVRRETAG
jgi:hypothetical protein